MYYNLSLQWATFNKPYHNTHVTQKSLSNNLLANDTFETLSFHLLYGSNYISKYDC